MRDEDVLIEREQGVLRVTLDGFDGPIKYDYALRPAVFEGEEVSVPRVAAFLTAAGLFVFSGWVDFEFFPMHRIRTIVWGGSA